MSNGCDALSTLPARPKPPAKCLSAASSSRRARSSARRATRPSTLLDPTAHAEMLAIRQAAFAADNYRLTDATLYATLEPCAMCAGALVAARIRTLVFGARDLRFGGVRSKFQIADSPLLNHRVEIVEGVLGAEATAMLQKFFKPGGLSAYVPLSDLPDRLADEERPHLLHVMRGLLRLAHGLHAGRERKQFLADQPDHEVVVVLDPCRSTRAGYPAPGPLRRNCGRSCRARAESPSALPAAWH